MKKKVILALSFLLISIAFVYDNHSAQSNDTALKNAPIKIEESNFLDTTKANNTEAFYLDYEDTLEDIKNSADLIVVGRVIKQSEYGEIGIKNTIMVTDTLKGKAPDEIYVLKSGSLSDEDYILKENVRM